MNANPPGNPEIACHEQELRIALVMNGGVSLAVWIGGVTQEINRLVRGETVYGRLCQALWLRPRVDIISGTSAGGINGALLALAMSQGKPLDPLRDIWLDKGDLLTLLRQPTQADPPSLLDGGYFYKAMLEGFRKIRDQPGKGLQPPDRVPIELTLTTTVLRGEVRDFSDDVGTLIRDVSHRGQMKFRRGPDLADDPYSGPDIVAKLAAAARATASFPAAFEPFYLPAADGQATAGGEPVPSLAGHANFSLGCFVVDGGVLDNNPLESAIEAVFRQRAEGEVRRVLAYVVPDPGRIQDPPPEQPDRIPSLVSTALAALVNIPRVESVSDQLRAIVEHNQEVARQRDTRLLVARSLDWQGADRVAESVFPGYRLRRAQSAADYIATALAEGAARHRDATGQGIALGRRARQRIAEALLQSRDLPWLPDAFAYAVDEGDWHWGLFTLENVMTVVLDLLRRGVELVPVRRSEFTEPLWQDLMAARRRAYDLVAELSALRRRDQGHWLQRGTALAPVLARLERGDSELGLAELLRAEMRDWVRLFDPELGDDEPLRPPRAFTALAGKIGTLFLDGVPPLRGVLDLGIPLRGAERFAELSTLLDFLAPMPVVAAPAAWRRLLSLEVVHYAFGADTTRDQYLELVQFSANVATAFGGPDRLEQKLAGVQVAHFGAFYKRSWRINDWMFGRLDGAERLVRILLDPSRLSRLYGREPGGPPAPETGSEAVLAFLRGAVLDGLARQDDRALLQSLWDERLAAMRQELAFLESGADLPDRLPECAAMVLERLHLDILRHELPALADAVGDDELDGADASGYGAKFLKRFRNALFPDAGAPPRLAGAPDLPAKQLVQLFRGARVGEEKVLAEAGSDRFTVLATRSAAVAVAALAGKGSGLKWLRGVFATVRTPLVALDILVRALMKGGKARVFVSLYAMAMAASATLLLAGPLAGAKWPAALSAVAGFILAAGFLVLLRRHPRLLIGLALAVALVWLVPLVRNCLG
ncbi:MAG: patatin-like protein [Hydrogenophilaceae bacterium]